MSALGTISIKQNDGTYKKYTVGINDTTNQYGNNIEVYEEQTKEERDAKAKKNYLASGRIFWTNGTVKLAEKKDNNSTSF